MKYICYITLFSLLFTFTACDFSQISTTGIFLLFGFFILCFIVMFYIIFKTQRNETRKMNQYVSSVNNMLANCKSPAHKEKELKILIQRIETDPKYSKNGSWKNKVLAKTYLFLATLYYNQNENDKVLDICNKILQLTPDDWSTLYNRGTLYLNKGDCEKAIIDFTACINEDAKNINALNNRGFAYEQINEREKALTDYKQALEIEKTAIQYLNLGNLYYNENQSELAKENYQAGLDICEDEKIATILKKKLSSLK